MRLPLPAGPAATGDADGLAYTLWLPEGDPWGRLVILHGAGSCKESHHDFARAAREAGLAAACFDMRGHGGSAGALDGRAILDVGTIAALLPEGPLFLRGSSMGGYLALAAGFHLAADAVVAICPASNEMLLRGLAQGAFEFRADRDALDALLAENSLAEIAPRLEAPVLLLHAEGDERVPVTHSRALAESFAHAASRLVEVPGGHHRSVQHDAELQGVALRWLRRHRLGSTLR
jgi:alpha-beta hydrolase superfamily lysophospholipase